MASRIEKVAAVRAGGAAAIDATCPWGGMPEPTSGASNNAAPAAPAVRSTCPWQREEVGRANKKLHKESRDTCPWSTAANDTHTAQIAAAERRRQKATPSFMGAAGSGAPKISDPLSKHFNEHALPEQIEKPAPTEASVPGGMSEAPQMLSEQEVEAFDVEEEDDIERQKIIEKCLAEGLEEDQIMEILEEWHCAKMIDRHRAKEPMEQTLKNTKKCVTINPNDSEIGDAFQDCSKENLTPSPALPNGKDISQYGKDAQLTVAAKRAKAKEPSEASLGSFNLDVSRAAYHQSKNQAQAAKNKNRGGAGIF